MSTHKPPSSRLVMPHPRPLIAGLAMVILGLVLLAAKTAQTRDLGWVLVVIGSLTACWWASEAWKVTQYRRALDRGAARKAELNRTRRQKEDEERVRRDADKRAREEQAAYLKEQRAEEGRRRREAEEAAARERAEREAAIQAEIARLNALTADALREEVAEGLRRRGYEVAAVDSDANDLSLRREDGGAVCRVVSGRSGRGPDVRELEAWRRDMGGSKAYLVCLAGFAPEAVRAAQGKPITLVEAHLLASWRTEQPSETTASETSPPR